MADVFDKEKRSWVMSRITGKDTKPERLLRSLLHRHGFRFTVNGPLNKNLPGPAGYRSPEIRDDYFCPRLLLARPQGLQTLPAAKIANRMVEGEDRKNPEARCPE